MRVFRYERLLHWSECDPAGIIFFPHYARWMVEGVNMMFLAFGYDPTATTDKGQRGLPSTGFATRFHSPAVLHDRLVHEVRVEKLGNKSITFEHRFLRGKTCVADATETRIFVETVDGRMVSIPVPDDVRAELGNDLDLPHPLGPTRTVSIERTSNHVES